MLAGRAVGSRARALELCSGTAISAADLDLESSRPVEPVETTPRAAVDQALAELPLEEARARWNQAFEREYVQKLLERQGGDFERAARAAKVHVKTLQRVARKHHVGKR